MSIKIQSLLICLFMAIMFFSCGDKSTGDAVPNAPSNLIGHALSNSSIQLSWSDNSTNEDGFIVFRSNNSPWHTIDSLSENASLFIDESLQDSTEYSYYVVAHNGNGNSDPSNMVLVTTHPRGEAPDTPSNPWPVNGETYVDLNIQLTWDCSDPEGNLITYDIYCGTDSIVALIDSSLADPIYSMQLDFDLTYYWKILARDDHQNMTEGPLWYFSSRPEHYLYFLSNLNTPDRACDIFIDNGYAYIADEQAGLQIIDIYDPENPSIVGNYDTPEHAVGVFVESNFAFIADGFVGGLQIVDISNPTAPFYVSSIENLGNVYDVFVFNSFAVIANLDSRIQIIDISDIYSPELIGAFELPGSVYRVFIEGNYAFADGDFQGLYAIDISTPDDPTLITIINSGQSGVAYVDDEYVYILTLCDPGNGCVKIFDISDVNNPTQVSYLEIESNVSRIYAESVYIYLVDGFDLTVIDNSNPSNPSILCNYHHSSYMNGPHNMFVINKLIYISSMDDGLYIFGFVD